MPDLMMIFTGIKSDFLPMVSSGLDSGCGVDDANEDGMSPLILASYMNRVEIASLLIDHGANLEFRFHDMTPVMAAAEGGASSTLEALLAAGADVNARSSEGLSSLMIAARDDRPDIARILITHGAEAELRTQSGSTALGVARGLGNARMVALLEPRLSPDVHHFMQKLRQRTSVFRESIPSEEQEP